jgi:hypothetical protein
MGPPDGAYCHAKYSLFDDAAVSLHTMGEGNKVAQPSSFFVDRGGMDFHLAAGSPAIGAAEPSQVVTTDFDGHPREAPRDMGAYEAR